jgi:hypothetical protein
MTPESERSPDLQLREYLEDLTEDPPTAERTLTLGVMRAARWQYVVRPYLLCFGRLLGAVGAALSVQGRRDRAR